MTTRGIRILDKKNQIVCVELPDILKEISNGNSLHWSILYLYATGHLGANRAMPAFEQQIRESEKGLLVNWDELNDLSQKFWDLMDMTLIGCKDRNLLRRYETDQELYEACDVVIEMIDSGYWEVFSKDEELINRLAMKFKDIKLLEADFEK